MKTDIAPSIWDRINDLRQNSPVGLAPAFRDKLQLGLEVCRGVPELDAVLFETLRSDELQAIYFQQKTTKARTARGSNHFYGLAGDVISQKYGWFNNAAAIADWPDKKERAAAGRRWFTAVASILKEYSCKWGGDWRSPDMPHFYWRGAPDSPSTTMQNLFTTAGYRAVWVLVGAETPTVLRRGDSGPHVATLQALLGNVVDGVFGAGTEGLVLEYQRKSGLVVDGIVGPKTWGKLLSAARD